MADTSTTVTTQNGVKTVSKTTTNTRPGKGWIKKGGKWVKPERPSGSYTWDDDRGWVGKQEYAQDYALALSVINSDPELKDLFNRAWKSFQDGVAWTEGRFDVELKKTKWYNTRSEAQRKFYVLSNDPQQAEEFNAQVGRAREEIKTAANEIGASLDANQADGLAKEYLMYGWNTDQLRVRLTEYISFTNQNKEDLAADLFGAAGSVEDTIRGWAKSNGIKVNDDWVYAQVKDAIAKNDNAAQTAKQFITNMAKIKYSNYADMIDDKTSANDIASHFINSVSVLHEDPYGTVDINDYRVQSLMNLGSKDNKKATMYEAEQWLRKQPEWNNTKNAQETVNGTVSKILNKFGF